jgi:O-antigen/teichoic acid export membrane protein
VPRNPPSLTRSVILNWLSLAVNFGVAFVMTPYIVRHLGQSGFGMWALIQSFSGYYGIINIGLTSALQMHIGRDHTQGNIASLQATVGTALTFFSISSSVLLLLVAAFSTSAAGFFDIEDTHASHFALTIVLCAGAVIMDFFTAVFTAMITARERFDLLNGLGVGRQLAQACAIALTLHFFPSLVAMAIVLSSASLLTLLAHLAVSRRLFPEVSFTLRGADKKRFRELLHFGSSTVLLRIAGMVRLRMGNVIVAKLVDLTSVAQYSIASNLIQNAVGIQNASLRVLTPRFTKLEARTETEEVRRLMQVSLFGSSVLAFGFALVGGLFGTRFIELWLGPGFSVAPTLLLILGIGYTLDLAQMPIWNYLMAVGRHHFMTRVTLGESVLILVLGILLAHTHGVVGFVAATSLIMIVTRVTITPLHGASVLRMSWIGMMAPSLVPFLTFLVLLLPRFIPSVESFIATSSILRLAALGVGTGLVYLLLIVVAAGRKDYFPEAVATKLWPARAVTS